MSIFKKSGRGWFSQSDRHSSARLTGHAGPLYSSGGKAISIPCKKFRIKILPMVPNVADHPGNTIRIDKKLPKKYRRSVILHEKVEAKLMNKGMPYEKAHRIAESAERRAFIYGPQEWDKYSEKVAQIHAQNMGLYGGKLSSEDIDGAISGEERAIIDYGKKISKGDENEKKVLRHIKDEEVQHLIELKKL